MLRHLALAAALACASCGIKGPLYLPPAPQPAPAATPPAATPPAQPGEAPAQPNTTEKKN
jgi:predicted small lipoprotein YifL